MKTIAIDAGHGINTPGKRTPLFTDGTYMKENEFNRATADYLDTELHKNGFQTLIVAPELEDTPLKTRVQRANQAGVDLYVSIHANAYGTNWNEANGVETYVYNKVGAHSETGRAAACIHQHLAAETGRKDRGVKQEDFYVLRETSMRAVLVECGFMTNLEEAKLLKSEDYRKLCAKAICKGICEYYDVTDQKGEEKKMTVEEAKEIVQKKCGFDENTMKYLEFYRYGESLLLRLAEAMK